MAKVLDALEIKQPPIDFLADLAAEQVHSTQETRMPCRIEIIRTAFIGAVCAASLPTSAGAATEDPYYCGSRFVTFAQLDSQGAATIVRTVRKDAVIRIIGYANGTATVSVKYGKTELSLSLPAGARERLVRCLN